MAAVIPSRCQPPLGITTGSDLQRQPSSLLLAASIRDTWRRHSGKPVDTAANLGWNSTALLVEAPRWAMTADLPLPLSLHLSMLKGFPLRTQRNRPCAIAPSVSAGAA